MAKPAVYEPLIIAELKRHPEGVTRRHLMETVGCSDQQVHNVVKKREKDPTDPRYLPIVVKGVGANGAQVLAWGEELADVRGAIIVPAGPERRVELGKMRLPALGEHLEVVAMAKVDGQITVVVRGEDGEDITFTR